MGQVAFERQHSRRLDINIEERCNLSTNVILDLFRKPVKRALILYVQDVDGKPLVDAMAKDICFVRNLALHIDPVGDLLGEPPLVQDVKLVIRRIPPLLAPLVVGISLPAAAVVASDNGGYLVVVGPLSTPVLWLRGCLFPFFVSDGVLIDV